MKLARLQELLFPLLALVVGLGLALAAGQFAGGGNTGKVAMIVAGVVGLGFFLSVRERMWMVIPVAWTLGGKVSVLPLPFTIAELGILCAFFTFLLLKALKLVRIKPTWGMVEMWLAIVLCYLATVFLRNPVGVDALGADRVGGRPYFFVAISVLAFWVLARASATPRQAMLVPLLTVGGNAFHAGINVIASRFPFTVGPLVQVYSGLTAAETAESGNVDQGNRLVYLAGYGSSAFAAAASYWRPLTLINPLNIGRFVLILTASAAVLLSGYRSMIVGVILFFTVSSYFRRGMGEVVRIAMLGLGMLLVIIVLQGNFVQLPLAAQRALSFLPGKWDYGAKAEAKMSTEWRVEMWRIVMTGNKYIENKWLGDGFGFTRRQLQIMSANNYRGTTADQHENLMINGRVHSGPISTIRYVGYVGLVLYLILQYFVARQAYRLIRRSQDTPFFPMALFIGVPALTHPFAFIFIFGSYDIDLPFTIYTAGMLKLLENSLDAHATQTPKPKPAAPLAGPAGEARPCGFRRPPVFEPARRA